MEKETPQLKLHSNNASGVKGFLRKSLGGDKGPALTGDLADKIKTIEEEGKKEEEAIQKKEFDSREERHHKRTKTIMSLLLGEDAEEEDGEEVLYHPTTPDSEIVES